MGFSSLQETFNKQDDTLSKHNHNELGEEQQCDSNDNETAGIILSSQNDKAEPQFQSTTSDEEPLKTPKNIHDDFNTKEKTNDDNLQTELYSLDVKRPSRNQCVTSEEKDDFVIINKDHNDVDEGHTSSLPPKKPERQRSTKSKESSEQVSSPIFAAIANVSIDAVEEAS